ncbi:MAG TPA: hypothetical protein VFA09_02675 [Ktedonobacteraceae bacterium]|nr:hypothetical protein [Ktedonobacteraceae bacterium]
MGYKDIKRKTCPEDEGDAILLVDIETEMIPKTDKKGHKQYYCLERHHTFSDDEGEEARHDKKKKG